MLFVKVDRFLCFIDFIIIRQIIIVFRLKDILFKICGILRMMVMVVAEKNVEKE